MNRGVEIDSRVVDSSQAIVERQVSNGVPIRMAVLYLSVAGSREGQGL
jgi:aspartate carbamoyltransferase catalytic subunit